MKLMKLNCSNCNAQLDLDIDNLQAYCPYCGSKLLLDFDQVEQILVEREKTKRALNRETEQTKRAISYEEEQTKRKKMEYEHEAKEKDKGWKRSVLGAVAMVLIAFGGFYYLPKHMFDADEKKHDEKVTYLQQLEIEIDAAIENEDYVVALLKANKLYCDDHWSSAETEAWDAKREAYIKIIEDKKREQDINNPNNIFMSASSDSFSGKKYTDIVEQLRALGFTNVSCQVALESAGLFKKADTVEHILVGGVTEFTVEDYFDKDTPIIVYYYSK